MDSDGIFAQILYPNIATFATKWFVEEADRNIHSLCIEIYNDFLAEFASEAPNRLIPIAAIPFWDVPRAIKELERASDLGHRGIMFSQDPSAFGLPSLADTHWDPIWAAAQERGLPVNFHIGSGDPAIFEKMDTSMGTRAANSMNAIRMFLNNADTVLRLIFGGVCHRYPRLNFVSVESGAGWLPFLLESMDWQWRNFGIAKQQPELHLLPSEYFRRQIYGSFWFETEAARFSIGQLEDNLFYETDFPHPTSMSPGPATDARHPRDYIADELGSLPRELQQKILHDNAARVYGLE
jgi:predicted TIM-barrel fold metal-dependent hydrolase